MKCESILIVSTHNPLLPSRLAQCEQKGHSPGVSIYMSLLFTPPLGSPPGRPGKPGISPSPRAHLQLPTEQGSPHYQIQQVFVCPLGAQTGQNLPLMQETQVRSLGQGRSP